MSLRSPNPLSAFWGRGLGTRLHSNVSRIIPISCEVVWTPGPAVKRVGEVDLRPHTHTCTHSPTFCSPVCTKYTYTLCAQHVQCNACTVIIADHDAYMTHTLLVDVKSSLNTSSVKEAALGVDFCSIASVFFWRISCSLLCVRSWRVIIPTTCMGRSKGCFFNRTYHY